MEITPTTPAAESSAAVRVMFKDNPVPAPGDQHARYLGGRRTYYAEAEIFEPGLSSGAGASAGAAAAATSFCLHDVVEVAGELGKTFLAQVEAFWQDSFTGVEHCRVRWILRASEIPNGDVSDGEAFLTTVSDDIEAANILRLARLASTPVDADQSEPPSLGAKARSAAAAALGGTRRGLRPKCRSPRRGKGVDGRSRVNEKLFLSRSYDPFSTVFGVLRDDHPALVQLRVRERAESSGNGQEKGGGGVAGSGRGSPRRRSADRNGGRAGVVRKGLSAARLLVPSPTRSAAGRTGGRSSVTSTESSSASISSGYSSSNLSVGGDDGGGDGGGGGSSNGEFASEDSQDDPLDDDDDDDADDAELSPASYHPKTRRGRRRQAAVLAAVATTKLEPTEAALPEAPSSAAMPAAPPATPPPARPRRLAMPPDDTGFDDDGAGVAGAHAATASAGDKRKCLIRGGPLIRAAHAGDNELEEDADSPKPEEYAKKEIRIGEDHQAEIPGALMTEAERRAERAAMEGSEMGGTQVWSSARDWTANDRERLDDFFEQAKVNVAAKRVLPGVPALIGISNGGDRRRKRKVAWAVMAGGKPTGKDKLRVTCAGPEVLEVSRDDVRPIQAEELAMHALVEAREGKEGGKLLDDPHPALNLLDTIVDDSGPLATWTGPQIATLSEALETHFDFDRYVRSRGHERHRDEHTDITSLIGSVDGKTPSQVLSFYYRCMATGDALTDVLKASEAPPKARVERKSMRPRVPPPPRVNPSLNLRHRPSLRCPTRLLGSSSLEDSEDSDSGDGDADVDNGGVTSYRLRTRRSGRNEKLGEGGGSGRGRGTGRPGSSGRAGRGGRPATRQATDRRAAVPEEGVAAGGDEGGEGVVGATAAAAAATGTADRDADASAAGGYGRPRSVGRSSTASLEEAFGGRSVAWVGERGSLSEVEGRGSKRTAGDRGSLGGVEVGDERPPQRARWQEGARPSIPADAVIVEVSDDEPMPAAEEAAAGVAAAAAAKAAAAKAAAAAAESKLPADSGQDTPGPSAPVYLGRPSGGRVDHPDHGDNSFHHQGEGPSPAFPGHPDDRRFVYNRAAVAAAAAVDPRQDHRFLRNHNDRRYYDDPRGYHERGYSDYDGNRQHSHGHNLPESGFDDHHRYGFGYGYGGGGGDGRGHRFAAAESGRRLPPAGSPGAGMPGIGASIRERQLQPGPMYGGDWNRGGGGGGGGGRVGEVAGNRVGGGSTGVGMDAGGGYGRGEDGLTPMDKCWMLVDYAQRDGLPPDRVEYLQGLFSAHEKKSMTYRMLSERTDSCLFDREDLQRAFLGVFAQMELPEPRRRAYRPEALGARNERHGGADYTAGGGYGVSSRAGGHSAPPSGYPFNNGGGGGGNDEPLPSLSSSLSYSHHRGRPALHAEEMERVAATAAAAGNVSKTMVPLAGEERAEGGWIGERPAGRRGMFRGFISGAAAAAAAPPPSMAAGPSLAVD